MVEATDELRRQIAEVIADYHGRMIQAHTLFRSYELAGELLPLVVAVVAEARTEQREADAQIAESLASSQPMPCCVTHEIERRGGTYVAEKIAAALRGVGNQKVGVTVDDLALDEMDGNQNAEPRWSANRLEEVLREGLPDQNAEPWGIAEFGKAMAEGNQNAEPERHKVCTCWRLNPDGTHQRGCDFFVADQKGTEQ